MSLENYTRKQRRQMADTLEKAKVFLWKGDMRDLTGRTCICFTLLDVKTRVYCELRYLIQERIQPCPSLRSWLVAQGVPAREMTSARVQAHRLAWMDLLIAELRGK